MLTAQGTNRMDLTGAYNPKPSSALCLFKHDISQCCTGRSGTVGLISRIRHCNAIIDFILEQFSFSVRFANNSENESCIEVKLRVDKDVKHFCVRRRETRRTWPSTTSRTS